MPNYFQTIVILFIHAAYTPNTTMLHPFWFLVGVSEAILNAPGYPRGWISEIHSEPCSTVHSLRVDTSHDYNTWLPFFWVRVSDVILDSPGPPWDRISKILSEPCSTVHSLSVDTSHDYIPWLLIFGGVFWGTPTTPRSKFKNRIPCVCSYLGLV